MLTPKFWRQKYLVKSSYFDDLTKELPLTFFTILKICQQSKVLKKINDKCLKWLI